MRDLLFEPIRIRGLEVKNRIYMPAMHMNMAMNYEVTDQLVDFYAENHRQVTLLSTERFGRVVIVEVGAMTVGTIQQCYAPGRAVEKGERKGYFDLGGSTVVLVFEPGTVVLDEDLYSSTRNEIETHVQMGERIGVSMSRSLRPDHSQKTVSCSP